MLKKIEIKEVILENDISIKTKSVVLTTGTFLGGVIHIGNERIPAGRIGDEPSNQIVKKNKRIKIANWKIKNRHTTKIT